MLQGQAGVVEVQVLKVEMGREVAGFEVCPKVASANLFPHQTTPGHNMLSDIIFVTSSTSSASLKYFWIWVKLYRINTLTTLLEGKCVKIITQDVSNCKENYTRG